MLCDKLDSVGSLESRRRSKADRPAVYLENRNLRNLSELSGSENGNHRRQGSAVSAKDFASAMLCGQMQLDEVAQVGGRGAVITLGMTIGRAEGWQSRNCARANESP
jgi:hypothetical protein